VDGYHRGDTTSNMTKVGFEYTYPLIILPPLTPRL
jgi:hypothetical protein